MRADVTRALGAFMLTGVRPRPAALAAGHLQHVVYAYGTRIDESTVLRARWHAGGRAWRRTLRGRRRLACRRHDASPTSTTGLGRWTADRGALPVRPAARSATGRTSSA
ncbi:MAG: hypothetical protein MZV63_16780 [Marinilabiliales bacterium]|nr:hypothetical protein [Marinilabiliales bacterium]